jgi:hypothetical protein
MSRKIDVVRNLTAAKNRLELIEYEIWVIESIGTIGTKSIKRINELATNARITLDDTINNLRKEKEKDNA